MINNVGIVKKKIIKYLMVIKVNMLLLFVVIKYLYLFNFDEFRIVK